MTDLMLTQAARDGRLSFTATQTPQAVRGLSQLVQQVVVDLLSDYREDLGRGCGLSSALSQVTTDDLTEATSIVAGAVRAVSASVLARQSRASNLSAAERLRSLTAISVDFINGQWDIRLELIPESGPSLTLSVPGV